MNWLARIEIDAEAVRREGAIDNYSWHKLLWECFPGRPESNRDFLTRIDQLERAFRLWIMSREKPVCPTWCRSNDFSVKKIADSFLSHDYYAFDLKANPIKAVVQRDEKGQALMGNNGKRMRGKRIPLVKQDELKSWLKRKADISGFRVLEEKPLEISPMIQNHFRKPDKNKSCVHTAYHAGVQFRGLLEVIDKEKFAKAYSAGIGSAKSFGFGLLLLAPVKIETER